MVYNIDYEFIESNVLVNRRLRILAPNTQDFLLWEFDSEVFFDMLLLEETQIPDARGYLFFDSEIQPLTFDYLQIRRCNRNVTSFNNFGVWPFFDIEDLNFFSNQLMIPTVRRFRYWKKHFGCFQKFFNILFDRIAVVYFISFTLVGVGYFCEFFKPNNIRLIISNTHDFVLLAPPGVMAGCRPANNDNSEATAFFFCSPERQLLLNYAQNVRRAVRFNIYEYQGLLFTQEKKIKKITKRRQK